MRIYKGLPMVGTYVFLIACLSLVWSGSSVAGNAAKPDSSKWEKFGEVSFKTQSQEAGQETHGIRFVVFENDDILVEIGKGATSKKALFLPSQKIILYFGLSQEELALPYPPFTMVEYGLIHALAPLSLAFPGGIKTVPPTAKQFSVAWEGASYEGTARRASDHAVTYDITMKLPQPDGVVHITGSWSDLRPSPLAEDYSVQGWRIREQIGDSPKEKEVETGPLQTLGQVRKLRTTSP